MGSLKEKIKTRLNEATVNLKKDQTDDLDDILPKLDDKDIVRFVDENELDEVNQEVLNKFIDQYGEEKGKQIYYATANKQDRDPETFHTEGTDWEQMLRMATPMNEEGEEAAAQDVPKLKSDVQKFMTKLGSSQFGAVLQKIDTPQEKVEMIASFAELIGVPRAKLGLVVQQIKAMATESVKPKMKKSDLEKYLTENKKK